MACASAAASPSPRRPTSAWRRATRGSPPPRPRCAPAPHRGGAAGARARPAALGGTAENARLALPPARLGIGYHMGGVERIVAIVGPSAASEIFFTARQYTAAEALRIRLVEQGVPHA